MSGNIVPPEGPPLEYWFGQYSDPSLCRERGDIEMREGMDFRFYTSNSDLKI